MKFYTRTGSQSDLVAVLQFLKKRETFPNYIGFEKPEAVRPIIARSFRAHRHLLDMPSQLPFIVACREEDGQVAGYIMMILRMEESITGQINSIIYDIYADEMPEKTAIYDALLKEAGAISKEAGVRFVSREVLWGDSSEEDFFSSRGFAVEMNRIIKEVGTYTFDSPRQKNILVEFAKEGDRPSILLLNAQNSSFLVPSGRTEDIDAIRDSFFNLYAELPLFDNPFMKVLVARDMEKFKTIGYIMISLNAVEAVSEKPLAYIYDLSVNKEYWGKYVGQRLVKEAENMLTGMGIHYLIGDTAENNPRALKSAMRTLNFKIFCRRWIFKS